MNKFPIAIYLLPLILLLCVVIFLKGSTSGEKIEDEKQENLEITEYIPPDPENKDDPEPASDRKIKSRIPVYPDSNKLALDENADVKEAAFYLTTDPMETVRDWYLDHLGGLTNVNLIDVIDKNQLRTITISMPDPPRELLEIKERFKGSKDLILTITTVSFYTRSQPRFLDKSQKTDENKENTEQNDQKLKENEKAHDGDDR